MAEWDTQALFTRVVTDARVPLGAQYRSIDNLLPVLNRHLRALVVPRLLNVCEDWLTQTATVPIVSGQSLYRLPSRNLRVLDVAMLDAQGRVRRGFSRATAAQAKARRAEWWIQEKGTPLYWLVEGGNLHLYPTPDTSNQYTLSIRFARRPGRLVDSEGDGVWTVVGFDATTAQVTLRGADVPLSGVPYDFLAGVPSFDAIQDDATVSDVSGGAGVWTATLSNWAGSPLVQDGYMSLSGTSPVPQIPVDYITILELAAVEQLCRENGDRAGSESARDARVALMESAQSLLEPRADEPQVVVPALQL